MKMIVAIHINNVFLLISTLISILKKSFLTGYKVLFEQLKMKPYETSEDTQSG